MEYNKLNVIGDIHGRTCWKELVIDDAINVFVGDYFSPYHPISFEDQKQNFLEIIKYKKNHPQTILLIGNHDEDHWHICEGYSRHDWQHLAEIKQLFEDNKELFQVAYSWKNQVLVTHAGVSHIWYNYRVLKDPDLSEMPEETRLALTPDIVAAEINKLWLEDPVTAFNFRGNAHFSDYCGTSEMQSPMWIREQGLSPTDPEYSTNIFKGTGYVQVYGHTINDSIIHYSERDNVFKGQCYMVDCLEYLKESLLFEIDEAGVRHVLHFKAD